MVIVMVWRELQERARYAWGVRNKNERRFDR